MTKEQSFKEWLQEFAKDLYRGFKDMFKSESYIAPPRVLLTLLLEPLSVIAVLFIIASARPSESDKVLLQPLLVILFVALLHFMYRAEKAEKRYKEIVKE